MLRISGLRKWLKKPRNINTIGFRERCRVMSQVPSWHAAVFLTKWVYSIRLWLTETAQFGFYALLSVVALWKCYPTSFCFGVCTLRTEAGFTRTEAGMNFSGS